MARTKQQLNNVDSYGYPLLPGTRKKLRNIGVRTCKSILGKGIYAAFSIVGGFLWLRRLGKRYSPLRPGSFSPKRILVIRLDLIGDLVLSLTLVRVLKRTYPEAEIDLLALSASSKIALSDPDLAQIIPYDPNVWRRPKALIQLKNWRDAISLRRRLNSGHYDLAVSVFGNWAGILAVLSGAGRRLGFERESYPGFMTDIVRGRHWGPHDHKHEVDYCLELAEAAGATLHEDDRVPHLYVATQAQEEIEQLLSQRGIQQGKPLIACHVSSNNGFSKRWPIPYWARLIDRMIREDDAQVVLTGTADDLPLIESVTGQMQERAFNLAGKTSLMQLAALLQRADLLISGDSGPMHIAAAVGTPLIAIHGPTDPTLTGPISPTATILKSGIWCSPCYNAKAPANCRYYTTQCMKNILPVQVLEVARQKLMEAGKLADKERSTR